MTVAEHKSDSNSQDTHTLPSRVSYEVSLEKILEKIDHVITALHCTSVSKKELWEKFQ